MTDTIFFGYANQPELTRETVAIAAQRLNESGKVHVQTWEDLQVAGRLVMKRVLGAIDEAAACAFDVSTLNENVLFELGYAVMRAKPIWLCLDRTDVNARTNWKAFQLLKRVGYRKWTNAQEITSKVLLDRPDLMTANLYDDLIDRELGEPSEASLFYVQAYHPTEAAQQISRRLDQEMHRGVHLFSADPTESALNPLQWYASKIHETTGSIVHFQSSRRELSKLHNPRSALVAGMAHGLDRPLLMLAEGDYSPPFDYEDMLSVYESSRECALILEAWLAEQDFRPRHGARVPRVKLATELRTLRFGEPVAENERETLSDYFVETSAFDDVLSNRNTLFIGRKGTGKTATMYQAASRLSEDARNLVLIIKPASYEFSSLLMLLSDLPVSMQQYSIEALWKFLLTSEIANRAVEVLESRRAGVPYSEEERDLLDFVNESVFDLRSDFSSRFERTVQSLSELRLAREESEGRRRDLLNEALHSQPIARLRSLLGAVLKSRRRVAILIDNLDKGWERTADLELMSKLLLGLLSAIGKAEQDFAREDYWRDKVTLSVATFLRADIYEYLRAVAREPDKIPAARVAWEDNEVLLRMLEERFLAARPDGTEPDELWTRFFCSEVEGMPTKQFLTTQTLPRPRDLIILCNAAVVAAADRGHEMVMDDDFRSAKNTYSQFAFEALLVENGITITEFQEVLLEFLGEPSVLSGERALELLAASGIDAMKTQAVFTRLQEVSFLGVETADERFDYPEAGHPSDRASVLARKLTESRGGTSARFAIHPAYRAYLESQD